MRLARIVIAAVLGASVVTGCSGGSVEEGVATSSSEGADSTTSTTAQPPMDVLKAVSLKDVVLPEGLRFELLPGGDEITGQVTLDMCGVVFPSEGLRLARYQRAARKPDGESVINNENVIYRTAGDATQALNELRAAISGCNQDEFIPSTVQGVPPLRYRLQPIAPNLLTALAGDHVAVTAEVSSQQGETRQYALIYQRRGAILVGTFGRTAEEVLPYAQQAGEALASVSAADARE